MAGHSLRTTTAMASAYLRGARRRLSDGVGQSRLMAVTLLLFLTVYLAGGFVLFSLGLFYLDRLPLLGGILVERVLYLIFFFFFLMLVFSNAVISYLSLFRSRETQWLMGLPISMPSLLLWKVTETLVISSWGLVFMSAPIFAAYANLGGSSLWFYPKALVTLILFVGIPACIGTWILLLLIRFYHRNWKWVILAGVAVALIGYGLSHDPISSVDEDAQVDIATGLNQVLRHTELSIHPLLPSSWLSEATYFWSLGEERRAAFFAMLLTSYALMGLWLTTVVMSRLYLPAWNASVRRRGRDRARNGDPRRDLERMFAGRPQTLWGALSRKDFLSFKRDAGKYGQYLVVFGLLFLYAYNLRAFQLRSLNFSQEDAFWVVVISYLNLTVCSLALSTLTTRFVYPEFSLEGRRLWLLGVAPMELKHVLWQKIVTSTLLVGVVMVSLMLLSGQQLDLGRDQTTLFVVAIALMSLGLSTLAVSLGALFPNLKESNPAKVVSGTGGTLCLILSFVYIVGSVAVLIHPAIVEATGRGLWAGQTHRDAVVVALVGLTLWTLLLTGPGAFFAHKRVKTLAILAKM